MNRCMTCAMDAESRPIAGIVIGCCLQIFAYGLPFCLIPGSSVWQSEQLQSRLHFTSAVVHAGIASLLE